MVEARVFWEVVLEEEVMRPFSLIVLFVIRLQKK